MSDRWIPVLAAVVGVIGGMGGALVGGLIANQGQQQTFESEQEAARKALRQDAYASYLEAANTLFLTGQRVFAHPDDISDETLEEAINGAFSAQAAVEVVAPAELRAATTVLTNMLGRSRDEWSELDRQLYADINDQRDKWIELAQQDLEIETDE